MVAAERILIVEDDVLIGMLLADMIDALGLPEPLHATRVDDALAIIAAGGVGGALVDINLGEEKGWSVADALTAAGIGFAFSTGGGDAVPSAHADRPLITKPFRMSEIESVLATILPGERGAGRV